MKAKRKIYLTVATVVIAIGAIAYFIVYPTWRDIRTIAQAIQREQADLEIKYQRGQRIREISSEYEKIKPQRDRLNTMFVPSGDELQFITRLEQLQRQSQVEVELTPDQQTNSLGPTDPLTLTLAVRGSYLHVLTYVIALERLNYYLNVSGLAVSGTNPDTGALTLTLNGRVYRKAYQPKSAASETMGKPTARPTATAPTSTRPALPQQSTP